MNFCNGDLIKLKGWVIKKSNIPEDMIYGDIEQHTPERNGAWIKHNNGEIFAWDYSEFELVMEVELR